MSAAKNVTAKFIAPVSLTNPHAALAKGVARSISLLESNLVAPLTVKVSGTGVSASSPTLAGNTLTVKLAVSTTATVGLRTVTVTNGDGQIATCIGCLTVDPSPTVKSFSVKAIKHGTSVTSTLTGTGFTSSSSVSFSGTGLSVVVTYKSATSLSLRITASSSAARSARKVTVTNPDGGIITATGITVQ